MQNNQIIAVWGPFGSTGKSTLAINIACELAAAAKSVVLIDLDVFAPSLAQHLGLTQHPAGLAAACRLINQGRFDLQQLERLSARVQVAKSSICVMTGLTNPERWPEVYPEAVEDLLKLASENFDYVVLDLASPIESGMRSSSSGVERNAATVAALRVANSVVRVIAADPISIERYLQALPQISQLRAGTEDPTLVNRLRKSVLGANAKQEIIDTLERLANVTVSAFIPDDQSAADQALLDSKPIALGRRASPAKQAIATFTRNHILGQRAQLDRRVAKLG